MRPRNWGEGRRMKEVGVPGKDWAGLSVEAEGNVPEPQGPRVSL